MNEQWKNDPVWGMEKGSYGGVKMSELNTDYIVLEKLIERFAEMGIVMKTSTNEVILHWDGTDVIFGCGGSNDAFLTLDVKVVMQSKLSINK